MDRSRVTPAVFRRALLLGVAGAFLAQVVVVSTISVNDLGQASVKLFTEAFADNADVAVSSKGIQRISSATTARGDSPPGIEATSTLSQVNGFLTKNHYAYVFEIKEAAADKWKVGDNFNIEVYAADDTRSELLASLHFWQGLADDAAIEGVTVKVDMGKPDLVYHSFDVVVTRY